MASGDVIKTKLDWWGRERKVVKHGDWTLVRPICKEIGWPISEAINHPGVERVFFGEERNTRFAIPNDSVGIFKAAGRERGKYLKNRMAERIKRDAAYKKRVEKQGKVSSIYREHRKECATALDLYNGSCNEAEQNYHSKKSEAARLLRTEKAAAVDAYKEDLSEADEDRDEALKALEEE